MKLFVQTNFVPSQSATRAFNKAGRALFSASSEHLPAHAATHAGSAISINISPHD